MKKILLSILLSTSIFTAQAQKYVDLGLSVKWATCNLGSHLNEDIGTFYYPGSDIEIIQGKKYKKNDFPQQFTEYSGDINKDPVTKKLGAGWRTPTYNEWSELIDQCTWRYVEYINKNGEKFFGYEVTGRNGNSILLPSNYGNIGYYQTSTPTSNPKKIYVFAFNNKKTLFWKYKYNPYFIKTSCRPVFDNKINSRSSHTQNVVKPAEQNITYKYEVEKLTNNTKGNSIATAYDLYMVSSEVGLNVRSQPNTNSSILGRLANKTQIEVVRLVGNWAEIKYNNKLAYVHSSYIIKINSTVPTSTPIKQDYKKTEEYNTYKVVNAQSLNVRSAPTTKSGVVGILKSGEEIEVISISNNWAKIKYKGKIAYVSVSYLQKVEREKTSQYTTLVSQKQTTNTTTYSKTNTVSKTTSEQSSEESILGYKIRCMYSQNIVKKDDSFNLDWSLILFRQIAKPLYIGTGLGIKNHSTNQNYNISGLPYDNVMGSMTSLYIPIELGLRYPWENGFSFDIYTGPRFDFILGGKTEYKYRGKVVDTIRWSETKENYEKEYDKKLKSTSSLWVFGGGFNIYGFDIGFQYQLNMTDRDELDNNEDYWGVYIGFSYVF